jgi:hypothetical protein
MIAVAALEIAAKVDGDADTIAEHYSHPMDGYELARELDRRAGWDLTMSDVEELDCMSGIVDAHYRAAEKKWFEENDIQPTLPNGTRIKEGVISGICQHSPARYLVKENGCTQDGRWLLVKFEDAVAA